MGDRTWKVTTIVAEIDDDLVRWKGTVEFLDGERAQIGEDYDEDVADEITEHLDELATRLHQLGKEQWTRVVYSLRSTGEANLELQYDGRES